MGYTGRAQRLPVHFASLTVAMAFAGCQLSYVGLGESPESVPCGIYSRSACVDSTYDAADGALQRATYWDPEEGILYESEFSSGFLLQHFQSIYRDGFFKDSTYWFLVDPPDTVLLGYAVYRYWPDTSVLQHEGQYDFREDPFTGERTPVKFLDVEYDRRGEPVLRREIFEGVNATVYEFDEAGRIIKTYNYPVVDEVPQVEVTDTVYTYYNAGGERVRGSTYRGDTLLDSTVYDGAERIIEQFFYRGDGSLERTRNTTYREDSGQAREQILEIRYDALGAVAQMRLYNQNGLLTAVRGSPDEPWRQCAEPYQFQECEPAG